MKSLLLALLLALASTTAHAGEWGITPISLVVSQSSRSPVLTVSNAGKTPTRIHVRLVSWSQNAEAKDETVESKDLIYFPRTLNIPPGEDRSVRVGLLKPTQVQKEKSYRLILEEIPNPNTGKGGGASVSIVCNMSLPVYLQPATENVTAAIGQVVLEENSLVVPVTNTGNEHFTIRKVSAIGKGKDGKEVSGCQSSANGWHLLSGVERKHRLQLPESCSTADSYIISVETTDPLTTGPLSKAVLAASKAVHAASIGAK